MLRRLTTSYLAWILGTKTRSKFDIISGRCLCYRRLNWNGLKAMIKVIVAWCVYHVACLIVWLIYEGVIYQQAKNKSLSWAGLVILVVQEPLESLLKETGQEAVIWTQQLLLVRVADTKLARQIQVEVRQYTQFAPGAREIDSPSYCWRGMG